MSDDQFIVVDLFCGAGGLSEGLVQAITDINRETIAVETGLSPGEVRTDNVRVQVWLEDNVELHAVNHWDPAIETHEENHPCAHHYHARIEEIYPPEIVEPGEVDLLAGGPECTHFSNARGGKPVSDQKRASAWHVLDWIEKLRPKNVLLENVKEFRSWGPIDENGDPTKDGSIFSRWVGMLEALGYSVVYDDEDEDFGVVLNAADYGDPQSRERLFIMASRETLPTPPEPTHVDDDPDKPDRRTASDVIDWSNLGTSVWTRDLEEPGVTPLANNTMERIAEGIRRHCSPRLGPFADVLEQLGTERDRKKGEDVVLLDELRELIVPVEYAGVVASIIDEPFLVHDPGRETAATPSPFFLGQHSGSVARDVWETPLPTVTTTSRGIGLSQPAPFVLGQHSNSVARAVSERPSPTVASGGKLQLCSPETICLRQQSGGVPVPPEEPLSTVSSKGAIGMATVESNVLIQPKNGQYGGKHSNLAYDPIEEQHHTVTTDPRQGHVLTPSLIRYAHGGAALGVDDPMPTVATEKGGTFAMSEPYLCPMYSSRVGQRPRTRSIGRPLPTIPARKESGPAGLAMPFLVDYQGPPDGVDDPIGTLTSKDGFGLCVPEAWPWGLDIRYRMLEPYELKQAQGFPEDYDISGSNKEDITRQIGNAVPVHLARALTSKLLSDEMPSLSTYGGGISPDPDVEIPDYEEVASRDD